MQMKGGDNMRETTIAAISTPLGAGGIGIVRMSGPMALEIAAIVFRANSGKAAQEIQGYNSALGRVHDGGEAIDDAILHVYRAPRSYTGEDIAELSCHGGSWVLRRVLRLCTENGAELAGPGEFTKRAFLNGKLGLTEAEAVMDIIMARGEAANRAAISAKDSAISSKINGFTKKLVYHSAHLAAWADFPDEDLEKLDTMRLGEAMQEVQREIEELLRTYDAGRAIREGIPAAIVGKPNVGKSTLMNLLSGDERSIVTDIPGTTRDVIEDVVRLGDFILLLADTAGIRETEDPVESAGVHRSRKKLATAELIFAVFDSADELTAEDIALIQSLPAEKTIAVINKIDLPQKLDRSIIEESIPRVATISAKDGAGLTDLRRAAEELLGLADFDSSAGIIINERQRVCLVKARDSLAEGLTALDAAMLDAVSVSLDYAIEELLTLTGEKASDLVIDEVFSRFCVGK
jgi:tRNA modification GTPase